MRLKNLFIFCCLLSIGACQTQKKVASDKNTKLNKIESAMKLTDTEIQFNRGACYGSCPIYDLQIKNNQVIAYFRQFCDKEGVFTAVLNPTLEGLIANQITDINWNEVKDYYQPQIPDLPSRTLMVKNKSLEQTTHWLGNSKNEKLDLLGGTLSTLYKDLKWTPKQYRGLSKAEIPHEVLVKFKDGIEVYNWVIGYSNYEVNPKEAIDNSGKVWRLTYNPEKVQPSTFMKELKADKDIVTSSFNVRTKQR